MNCSMVNCPILNRPWLAPVGYCPNKMAISFLSARKLTRGANISFQNYVSGSLPVPVGVDRNLAWWIRNWCSVKICSELRRQKPIFSMTANSNWQVLLGPALTKLLKPQFNSSSISFGLYNCKNIWLQKGDICGTAYHLHPPLLGHQIYLCNLHQFGVRQLIARSLTATCWR